MPLLNPNNYKILKYISYNSHGFLNEAVPSDWPIVLYNPELANKKFLALKNPDGSIVYQENDEGTLYEHDDDFSLDYDESDEDESGEMNSHSMTQSNVIYQNPDLDDDFSLGEEESDEEQQANPPVAAIMPVVPSPLLSHSNNGLFNDNHALNAHRRRVVRNLLDDLNFKP